MKKCVYVTALLFTFFSFNCSFDQLTDPAEQDKNPGKVSIKFNKATTPDDVVTINAVLEREGFTSFTSQLNFASDSIAEISFSTIPAGEWKLTVQALDASNSVLYVGETPVTVFTDSTTNVRLTLNEVESGTGSVDIIVDWQSSFTSGWVDYPGNPVLNYTNSYYDLYGVQQPKILYENGIYRMWYNGLAGGSRSQVCYAESHDGINWNTPYTNPILSPGTGNAWDNLAVIAGAIINDNGIYKMYYVGWSNQYGHWNIGLATSSDGIHWNKEPNPIIYSCNGWEYQIIPAAMLKVDGVYYLYYYGRNYPQAQIGLLLSSDGIHFTRYSGTPILSPTEPWEGTGIYHPTIIKEGTKYRMVYSNIAANALGYAVSDDGKTWVKSPSPFFTTNDTHAGWASESVAYPNMIKVNGTYSIYYSGYSSSNDKYRIGVIQK